MARFRATDKGNVPFTPEEEAARDAEEAQVAQDKADYIANEKYKDDRRKAYGDVGEQLDQQYWDGVNGTTVWPDHIAQVKSDYPKPS